MLKGTPMLRMVRGEVNEAMNPPIASPLKKKRQARFDQARPATVGLRGADGSNGLDHTPQAVAKQRSDHRHSAHWPDRGRKRLILSHTPLDKRLEWKSTLNLDGSQGLAQRLYYWRPFAPCFASTDDGQPVYLLELPLSPKGSHVLHC
jgi:hypothetical protein